MFLKQEKLETDDYERKKNFRSKGKINFNLKKKYILRNVPVFNGCPYKNATTYFCIFFCFRTFQAFFFLRNH